jgi:alkylation response protein AidB-like acyl-CoA dehydrogenase
MKLAFARHMKHMTETAVAMQGLHGLLAHGEAGAGTDSGDGAGDGLDGGSGSMWRRRFLHSPSLRIAGGSDQVQANILGERALGLPREPAPDRDVPFRQAQSERQ